MTECIQQSFDFQGLGDRKVVVDFKGGNVSADGGVLLLREIDARTGLVERLGSCFIVTNLPRARPAWESVRLYREFYCARGDMESERR